MNKSSHGDATHDEAEKDDEFARMTRIANSLIEADQRRRAASERFGGQETSAHIYLAHAFLKYAARSETRETEGYTGIAHDFETMRTTLRELEQASLRMAQCWNRAGDKHSEGVTTAEMDAARQGVDVARRKAHAVLTAPVSAIERTSWIDVKERTPDAKGFYQVWDAVKARCGILFWHIPTYSDEEPWNGYYVVGMEITHWMPLPEGPK